MAIVLNFVVANGVYLQILVLVWECCIVSAVISIGVVAHLAIAMFGVILIAILHLRLQKLLQLFLLQVLRKGAKTIVRILVYNSELQKTMSVSAKAAIPHKRAIPEHPTTIVWRHGVPFTRVTLLIVDAIIGGVHNLSLIHI